MRKLSIDQTWKSGEKSEVTTFHNVNDQINECTRKLILLVNSKDLSYIEVLLEDAVFQTPNGDLMDGGNWKVTIEKITIDHELN